MMRSLLAIVLSIFCLGLSACRKQDAAAPETQTAGPYRIGILQSVDSPTANEVRRGILQALAEAGLRDGQDVVVTIRIANNDIAEVQRMARELAERADMIVPLSTQALQAAILTATRKPVVFGAVAVPYLVGAGQSASNHLANVTGVASTGPVRETLALIREVLPKAKRIGTLWTSSEINSEYYLDLAKAAAADLGFEIVAVPVTGPPEIQRALQRVLNEKIDVLYPMSDNTLNSSFDIVGRASEENATPLFASFLRSVEFGACAALGFDFAEMGLRTGRLAVRVKNGENPGRIPIESMGAVKLYVNEAAAARQMVVFPKSVLVRASRTISQIPAEGAAPGFFHD